MADSILGATDSTGEVYDDPSEDARFMFMDCVHIYVGAPRVHGIDPQGQPSTSALARLAK
jgi:hypothetical protein